MLNDRIEDRWISAFAQVFDLCRITADEQVVILSETQSRPLIVHLAELALHRLGRQCFHVQVPTPAQDAPVPIRSTGACIALSGQTAALAALTAADVVIDCTLEGLLHAPELPSILKSGTRVQMISNEHPDCLERLIPDLSMKDTVKAAVSACRGSGAMTVTSAAGTDLSVDMTGAISAGVWGWTDRPGTIAHWPGGVIVSFPRAGSTNGTLVLDKGDVNLTFKRYLQDAVRLTIEDDFVTAIDGDGTDTELMRRYLAAWDDRNAYAVSHVGWGLNPAARYEALTMYDQRDTNGTELRCFAGNFLFSTGANEFANRFTKGHFDLPVRGCDIALDGELVVKAGVVQS